MEGVEVVQVIIKPRIPSGHFPQGATKLVVFTYLSTDKTKIHKRNKDSDNHENKIKESDKSGMEMEDSGEGRFDGHGNGLGQREGQT